MKTIKNEKGIETLIFAETFEHEAFEQIKKLINFEAYENAKIRIMPDAHAGKGCVVGTTMTITNKVTPNLVGVDIGCGILTIMLANDEINFTKLDEVIKTKIPNGFNVHESPKQAFDFSNLRCGKHVDLQRASLSLGSLGGGNHFIEVGKSEGGDTYLIIHSGSRKLGSDVCRYYQKLAQDTKNGIRRTQLINKLKNEGREKEIQTELKKITLPTINKELAYLSGKDFDDYINDMAIVQKYAVRNRATIARIILKEMELTAIALGQFETIHNYIDFKRMILRKGAVSAEIGETLLIPINMSDGSLLCVGKGNPDWNYSAPHGAGRLMSRSKAKELLNMDDFNESMKTIFTTSVNEGTLDEAPQAYKSMDEIKRTITDTVQIIDVIKPLYNFKAQ